LNCGWLSDRLDLSNVISDFSLIDRYLLSKLQVDASNPLNLHPKFIYLALIHCYLLIEFVDCDIEVVNINFVEIYFTLIKS